jgi:two-component system response regulator AtoC
MARARILVVDDRENVRALLARILGEVYEVAEAEDGQRAISLLASRGFDVVLTDLRMPGADGFEVLRVVRSRAPDTEVVLMTAYATVEDAVAAMKQGAFDYLQKPFDPDDVSLVVARALEHRRLRTGARAASATLGAFGELVGRSAAMQELFRLLEQAAGLDITVLLHGETGTGKELAARAVHGRSARRERPFVPVNCGALPGELVESELFGHARGAFTGAANAKLGLFEEADGGTLFLDEIGDLPLRVQVKLNRALQEKEIRRVGDNTAVRVDVRLVAATHRELRAEVAAGRFREDLFYRLNVFPITLPPLRQRREDVTLLAAHFLEKHARAPQNERDGFDEAALRALSAYVWPGNVRELENAVARAVAVSNGPRVELHDLPPEVRETAPGAVPGERLLRMPYREVVDQARDRASRDYLVALLREFGGHVTHAAERAGMERESLHRLLKQYGVRADDFKARSAPRAGRA